MSFAFTCFKQDSNHDDQFKSLALCVKDAPAITKATNATFSLQLIVESFSTGTNPSLLLPFYQDNPAIMAATHAQNLLLHVQIGSANTTATNAQNSLLLCVQDDPANSKLHLIVAFIPRALTAQTTVDLITNSSLLLYAQTGPAITMVIHAEYSLQLIVESLFLLRDKDKSETMASSLLQ